MRLQITSYPEVIEDNSCAENISVKRHQVWLEGVDEESCLVSVDVQTVPLQQLLLVPPALWPVLRQLFHLRRKWPGVCTFSVNVRLVWCVQDFQISKTGVNVCFISTLLPLVHSAARCQTDFHPSHHSGMDWDYAAVSQESKWGEKRSVKKTCRKNVTFLTILSNLLPPTGLKMSSRGVPY